MNNIIKFYFIGIFYLSIACGSEQNSHAINLEKDSQVDCENLKLTKELVKTVFNDSTIVELFSKIKGSKIIVKHQESLSNKINIEIKGKKLDFQKIKDSGSVDGNVDYSKLPNLILTNGMSTKYDTSKINVVSIYFGIGVELKVKKDQCNWTIIEKFIYDT